jgi:C4-dicarboxylate transporter DctM subunit
MKPLVLVAQRMVTGLIPFPCWLSAFYPGRQSHGRRSISKRLVRWAESLVGGLPGGLGIVAILSCVIFAAISGSAPATVAAIGAIIIPSMVQKGYPKETSGGLIAAAGALGPIIPPSIPMIIYGVTMQISITDMFLGGVLPGIFIALLLVIVNAIIAKRTPSILAHRGDIEFSFMDVLKSTWSGAWRPVPPVLILGGIYGGIFTPTEAASIGVVYSLIVGGFVYKELKIKDLPKIFIDTMETSAMICFIVAAASLLSWIMSASMVSNMIVNALSPIITNQVIYLLILTLFLFS